MEVSLANQAMCMPAHDINFLKQWRLCAASKHELRNTAKQ